MTEYKFKVAEHLFRLSFPHKHLAEVSLDNYTPFAVEGDCYNQLFHLTVTEALPEMRSYNFIGNFDNDVASVAVSKNGDGGFCFKISPPGLDVSCTMLVDANFSIAYAKLAGSMSLRTFFLDNCLMLLYAFSTVSLDTLLIHASVVKNEKKGYAFLGKSGTGKSTHSNLWLQHIKNTELLNDDNPVVRIMNDKAYIFGSPWSGKTSCYKNEGVPLKGIVKLNQAPENKIRRLSAIHAYANLLQACSTMRWENIIADGVHNSIEKVVTRTASYHLDCLPDKDAALLSYETVNK